ncbi:hypothetical protein C6496_00680 [Candidatus Poribacteria bacterium]|nr:MAG: hypothetical protein C6496_00680 [Candidatus Poribacteria bacterium]
MKGRSKSPRLARDGDSQAERSPQVPTTEGRPGAANLNNKVGFAGMMPVIASQRVLFLMIEGFDKFDTSRHEKGNWSGTTVRSV